MHFTGPEGRHNPSRCRKAPVNGLETSGNPGGVTQGFRGLTHPG